MSEYSVPVCLSAKAAKINTLASALSLSLIKCVGGETVGLVTSSKSSTVLGTVPPPAILGATESGLQVCDRDECYEYPVVDVSCVLWLLQGSDSSTLTRRALSNWGNLSRILSL